MDEIDLRLASVPASVAAARRAVVGLDDLAVSERADASLLVSEVVTNSVLHAGAGDDVQILLRARLDDETLRVEVTDPGPGFERRPPEPRLEDEDPGGWGLVLVDRLADRWGVERGAGTCVWFEMDRSPAR